MAEEVSGDSMSPMALLRLDWQANASSPRWGGGKLSTFASVRFLAVLLFRVSQWCGQRSPALGGIVKQLNNVITGADLAWQAPVGGGLQMFHPTGVVIGPHVKLGASCVIQSGVTLGYGGSSDGAEIGSPTIGNGVTIGPGARVLGAITVGDGVTIAANAVVTRSVPAGVIAKGVPARW